MTLETRKIALAQYIFNSQENFIERLESIIESEAISTRSNIAEQQLLEGKVKTHEQAKEQLSKWLKK